MAQSRSGRSGACQGEGNDFVTAVASSSSSCGHEASKYMTTGMDEVQIGAAIEQSREQGWSEVADHVREAVAGASWSRVLSEEDQVLWAKLRKESPHKFWDMGERVKIGRVIAEGGQAHICEVLVDFGIPSEWVAKVFKMEGFSLANLHGQWPRATKLSSSDRNYYSRTSLGGVVFDGPISYCAQLLYGTFLNDGRFAFLFEKYWGDLRTLINLRVLINCEEPPFSNGEAREAMYDIAQGMSCLHEMGVLHRDLKAANVLIQAWPGGDPKYSGRFFCRVADYESSMLVQGTGFWRAPEVLEDLLKKPCDRNKEIWIEKVDVYAYAMTCYEILTGHTPFEGYLKSDWQRVIDGERPHLPDYVDPRLRELVERCWHKDPFKRPMFEAILSELGDMKFS